MWAISLLKHISARKPLSCSTLELLDVCPVYPPWSTNSWQMDSGYCRKSQVLANVERLSFSVLFFLCSHLSYLQHCLPLKDAITI